MVVVVVFKHSAKSSIAQEERLVTSPCFFFDKASPAARDSSGFARAVNLRCEPHTGNGGQLMFEQQPILVGKIFHPE